MNTQEIVDKFFEENKGNKNISKNKAEKQLGLGSGYLSRIKNPSRENLERIAKYMNITVDYLATGKTNDETLYTTENAKMLAKIARNSELSNAMLKYFELSDIEKKHVIELINLLSSK